MDGSLAIEANRQALKRIVAMLTDMAGFSNDAPDSPAIPRLLWRAILALLRPAESAARRLIIAASVGLAMPPATPRQPRPQTMEPLLRRLGIAVMMPPRRPVRRGPTGEGGWRGRTCAPPQLPPLRPAPPPREFLRSPPTTSPLMPPRASGVPASPTPRRSRHRHRPTTTSARRMSAAASRSSARPSTICPARPAALPG